MKQQWLSIISIALISISLLVTLLGVYKDIVPEKKIPSWLIFSTAILTGVGGVLQAFQDYRGLEFGKAVSSASEGISLEAEAPKKQLTEKEETLYTTLKKEASRFRSARIKLFFSPSLDSRSLYNTKSYSDRSYTLTTLNTLYTYVSLTSKN